MRTWIIAILISFVLLLPTKISAQEGSSTTSGQRSIEPETYYRARVLQILQDSTATLSANVMIQAEILDGSDRGKIVNVAYGLQSKLDQNNQFKNGEDIILSRSRSPVGVNYIVVDRFRLFSVGLLAVFFFATVIAFGRLRGFTSLLGLFITVVILTIYIIPSVATGENPLLVAAVGSFTIAILSIYTAHGLSKKSTVALVSTLITLVISIFLSLGLSSLVKLSGTASEEISFLQTLSSGNIDSYGLLLAGIIIGALGVLDDITIAQASTIQELSKANPSYSKADLYNHGITIGKDHIASLVNTLVLAYVGSSLPLLLLFTMNANLPLWVLANSELVIEEVVRSLIGSMSLILAVPISTVLSAYYLYVPKGKRK